MIRTLILGITMATALSPTAQALVMFSPKAPQVSVAPSVSTPQIAAPSTKLPAVQKVRSVNPRSIPLTWEPGPRSLTGGMPGPGPRQDGAIAPSIGR